jgi:hypothetical protein
LGDVFERLNIYDAVYYWKDNNKLAAILLNDTSKSCRIIESKDDSNAREP